MLQNNNMDEVNRPQNSEYYIHADNEIVVIEETTPLVSFIIDNESDKNHESYHHRIITFISFIFITIFCITLKTLAYKNSDDSQEVLASIIGPIVLTKQQQQKQEQFHHNSVLNYHAIPQDDFGPYKEYSVAHTDRSLNYMSYPFQEIMRDLNQLLKVTYNAEKVAIIPGSGTFGMEAVARQYSTDEHVMVLRNGYFSYRWTEIFEYGRIPASHSVLMAIPVLNESSSNKMQYQPHPIENVVNRILNERPAVFFAPHVETSTGIILPDDYIRKVSEAVRDVGGLFVLDCIASGTIWIDMKDLGVDVLLSAPQKGWTSYPCAALVQMSKRAVEKLHDKAETSFSLSLRKWSEVMNAYEKGGYAYHTTPPTDSLRVLQEVSVEMINYGFMELKKAQNLMGKKAREVMESKGLVSVAAPGFEAPCVLVYYSHTDNLAMVEEFEEEGLQVAHGVPWMINEPTGIKTFRVGLFGLDKLKNVNQTVKILDHALDRLLARHVQ